MKSTKTTAEEKYSEKKESLVNYDNLVARALFLKKEIEDSKAELDSIKIFFADEVFKGSKTQQVFATSKGTAIQQITNSYSIDPTMVKDLKEIFNGQYPVFVNEKQTFSPTAKMKELIADGDYKHKKIVRKAVVIKINTTINFEPLASSVAIAKSAKKLKAG